MTDVPPPNYDELVARVAELEARIHEYHRTELTRWADSVLEAQQLHEEIARIRRTLSWRITKPLRVVRARQLEG